MPKKTPEPEQAPKADNYAKINMPAAFLTPHDIQTSDGRTFEKCFVSFPKGTKVNGIDVSGFSTDVFLSDYMKKDMLEKGRATVSFKKDEPVPIWTGKKDDAEHPYQRYEVKATDLTHALKVAQDSYKAEKAADRSRRCVPRHAGRRRKGRREPCGRSARHGDREGRARRR